ncbi:uncharacterized protein [Montipora foliosa]|uniref:uncharacterized protein n=1 Tax=Montipora foliosa TaxID=591990 RepID=UPI0035F16460
MTKMVAVVHSALKLGQRSNTVRSRIPSRGYRKVDWQSATVVESVLGGSKLKSFCLMSSGLFITSKCSIYSESSAVQTEQQGYQAEGTVKWIGRLQQWWIETQIVLSDVQWAIHQLSSCKQVQHLFREFSRSN